MAEVPFVCRCIRWDRVHHCCGIVSCPRWAHMPAGMMGVIPSDIRAGLLELFYGVYEKDPDR